MLSRPFRRGVVAVLLALALSFAVLPPASSAHAAQGKPAKKCKKKQSKKKQSNGAAKKKCKRPKKKKPAVPPTRSSIVRATVTWPANGSGADLEIHAFDAAGNHTGRVGGENSYDADIPDLRWSSGGDHIETITDYAFFPGAPTLNRSFGYMVCFYVFRTDATFTGVDRNGVSHVLTHRGEAGLYWLPKVPGDQSFYPPDPGGYCN